MMSTKNFNLKVVYNTYWLSQQEEKHDVCSFKSYAYEIALFDTYSWLLSLTRVTYLPVPAGSGLRLLYKLMGEKRRKKIKSN